MYKSKEISAYIGFYTKIDKGVKVFIKVLNE